MTQISSQVAVMMLNTLYVSVIPPDRSREAFARTNKFKDKEFLSQVERLSKQVDNLVFDASFIGDIQDIKSLIETSPSDIVDVLVYRFNMCMTDMETNPTTINFPGKPDVLALLRHQMVYDGQLRDRSGPIH